MSDRQRGVQSKGRSGSMNLFTLAIAVPVIVILATARLLNIDLGLMPQPVKPVDSLAGSPYFSHPPVFPMANEPFPLNDVRNTATSDTPEKPLENQLTGISIKAYLGWVKQVDLKKMEMLTSGGKHNFMGYSSSRNIVSSASGANTAGDGSQNGDTLSGVVNDLSTVQDYDRFSDLIDRQPYPLECQELHDHYLLHLKALKNFIFRSTENEIKTEVPEAGNQVASADNGNKKEILDLETRGVNGILSDLCMRAKLIKPFEITAPDF